MNSLTAGEAIATVKAILQEVKPEDKKKTIKRLLAELQKYEFHEEEDVDGKDGEEEEDGDEDEDEDEKEDVDDDDEGEDDIMGQIIDTLRKEFPLETNNTVDVKGEHCSSGVDEHNDSDMFKGCSDKDTIAVDAFLYDEETIDQACDDGKFSRYYCASCGSHDVKSLNFISHSFSRSQIDFILSDSVLGQRSLNKWMSKKGLTIVDVGSRLGAVLYGFGLSLPKATVYGVEQNAFFCDVQNRILKNPSFSKALKNVHVIQDDVRNQAKLLNGADVVLLNNVFEFFASSSAEERALWQFVMSSVTKTGCIVITVPSLEEVMQRLNSGSSKSKKTLGGDEPAAKKRRQEDDDEDDEPLDFFDSWVEPMKIDYPLDDDIPEYECELQALINMYRVK